MKFYALACTSRVFLSSLGLAWRDAGDGTRMSRHVDFDPEHEPRDFGGGVDSANQNAEWVAEFTHALEVTATEGEAVVFWGAPGALSPVDLLGRTFPRLAGAIDVRPFLLLARGPVVVADLDEAVARPREVRTWSPQNARDFAVRLADFAEALAVAGVIPEDLAEARAVSERLRRGGV